MRVLDVSPLEKKSLKLVEDVLVELWGAVSKGVNIGIEDWIEGQFELSCCGGIVEHDLEPFPLGGE